MRPIAITCLVVACGHAPDPRTDLATPPMDVAVGEGPVNVAAGDLDGDGTLDLVTANAPARSVSVRLRAASGWRAAGELAVGIQPHHVALGDVDGDRDLDIAATAHDAGTVWVWRNDGRGAFAPATGSPIVAVTAEKPHNHGLALGDLDGNGTADVVAADQEAGAVAILLADGTGGFAAPTTIELGGQIYPPALGDVDGDGKLDVVAPLLQRRAIAILHGDGRGGFAPAPASPVAVTLDRPYAIALAHLDGGRSLDLVAVHDETEKVSVLLGGTAGFRPAPGSPRSTGRRVWRIALADVDGDGRADLVGSGGGSLVVMRGDGRGGFAAPQVAPSSGWVAITADLDGDGHLDIASPQPAENLIRVWSSRR